MAKKKEKPAWLDNVDLDTVLHDISSDWKASYEDGAVKAICTILDRYDLRTQVLSQVEGATGFKRCNLATFNSLSDMPVEFFSSRIRGVKYLAIPDLFNRPDKLTIVKEYRIIDDEWQASAEYEATVAMLFPWQGRKDENGRQSTIKGGRYMVLHDDEHKSCDPRVAIKIPYRDSSDRDAELTLETLASFLSLYPRFKGPR